MRELLLIAVVLACPLLMMWMMRAGHGHGHGGHSHQAEPREASTDELRSRRDELDRLLEEREQAESLADIYPRRV